MQKDLDRRDKLAELEPGGSAERPLEVTTASLVEPVAKDLRCARCEGPLRVDDHAARASLRVVSLSCVACGASRVVYVRIAKAN